MSRDSVGWVALMPRVRSNRRSSFCVVTFWVRRISRIASRRAPDDVIARKLTLELFGDQGSDTAIGEQLADYAMRQAAVDDVNSLHPTLQRAHDRRRLHLHSALDCGRSSQA